MGQIEDNSATYYRISDGKIRRTTTQDDPKAVKRVVTDRQTGAQRDVYEQVLKAWQGRIETVEVREGKFGDQLYVKVSDGFESVFLQMAWTSPYARTFLEKLPSVDINREVTIMPYQFTTNEGKERSGITIYYDYDTGTQEKVMSAFKEFDADGKTIGTKGGYPTGGEGMSKDEWKIIGLQQMQFLREKVVQAFPFTQADIQASANLAEEPKEEEKQEDKASDLPF